MTIYESSFTNPGSKLYSKTLEFNAYSEFDSIRFEKFGLTKSNFYFFFDFFSNFHDSVRPNRTSYLPNKALYSVDSIKRLLTRVRFGRTKS